MITVDTTNVEVIANRLSELPKDAKNYGVEGANEVIVDVAQNDFPAYRYVSRFNAYPMAPAGPGWFSDKQRRYVMARIASGEISIPYRSTHALRYTWRSVGAGWRQKVVNDHKAAIHAYGNNTQCAQLEMVGWKKAEQLVYENIHKIVSGFDNGVKKAIRKLRLD